MKQIEQWLVIILAIIFSILAFHCLWLVQVDDKAIEYEMEDDGIDRY